MSFQFAIRFFQRHISALDELLRVTVLEVMVCGPSDSRRGKSDQP